MAPKPGEKPSGTVDSTSGVEVRNRPSSGSESVQPLAAEKTPAQKEVDRKAAALEQATNHTVAEKSAEKGGIEVDRAAEDAAKEAEDGAKDTEEAAKKEAEEKAAAAKKEEEEKAAAKAKEKEGPKTLTELMEYWTKSVADNDGKWTWTAALMTAYYAFTTVDWSFGEEKENDDIDGPDGLHYRFEQDFVPPEDVPVDPKDPKYEKLLAQAKKQLDGVKEDHGTWIDIAKSASEKYGMGPKGPAIIFGMSRFESNFNPDAKAKGSSAAGLGQFIKGTWDAFQASLPEGDPLKGKPSTDPEAALNAIAWYSSRNMETCGLKPEQPDFAERLYETHHEGAAGAKKLWAFRGPPPGPEGRIPASYKGKSFKSFGVEKVETYEDYSRLISAMSSRVGKVVNLYETELGLV